MKKEIFVLSTILFLSVGNSAFSQEQGTQNPNELVVSDTDLTIIFSGFIIAVIAIFLYLARHQILRKKLEYDKGDFESKKNRDYEKYHSDWASYDYIGKERKSKDDKEFRKSIPELSIDDSIRLEEEIKNKDDQIHDLETDKDRRITNLEMMISEIGKRLEDKS